MKLASFDIFDTCLIRKCGLPRNIFFLLAKKLYPYNMAKQECFLDWRIEAEDILRSKMNKFNPTLEDIYSIYPAERFLEYDSHYVQMCELKVERQNLYKNKLLESIINEKRSEGFMIAFISDMYLESKFIKEILESEGLYKNNDKIYISSEYNMSKSNGLLYEQVRKDLDPSYWCHYGDNKRCDYLNARKKGIDAKLIKSTDYTPIEQFILETYKDTRISYLCSCFIGILRYARISTNSIKNQDTIEFSADVAIPIYLSFVLDILNVSEKEGIKRLYFLARDGWILYYIAQMLNEENTDIELKYLYVSRKSLYLPSMNTFNLQNIERCLGTDNKSINIEEIINYFKLNDFVERFSCKGNGKKFEDIFSIITYKSQNKILNDYIAKEKQAVKMYFNQEGLLDNIPYAFVDVGWKGSGLNAINLLQKQFGVAPTSCFYWHTFKRYRNNFPIIFYTHNNIELPKYFIPLVEDYFSANPQLSTIGYKTENGQTIPQFAPDSIINNDIVAHVNKTISKEIITCIYDLGLKANALFVFEEIEKVLVNLLIHKPYYFNFKALSTIKYYNADKGSKFGLSRKITFFQTFKYILGGHINELWAEACICYTYPKAGKYLIDFHRVAKKILKSILQKLHL